MSTLPLTHPHPAAHEQTGMPNALRAAEARPRKVRDARTDELAAELSRCEDPERELELRDQLVTLNIPVAVALANRYRNRGESIDDLVQVALVGLSMAARRFDPDAGHFHGYCMPTILGELRRHFRDRGWMVRPPRRVQEVQQRLLRVAPQMSQALGREPTAQEVADRLKADVADVREAMVAKDCYAPASLNRQLSGEDGAELHDVLPSGNSADIAAEARLLLAPAIQRLCERDQRIIRMRFFDDLTQREIAQHVGITQMQVSRVLTRIFADLRQEIGTL